MAIQPQNILCRRLTEAYVDTVLAGQDIMQVHISWITDILDYLNSIDTSRTKIHKPFLDDQSKQTIENFIKLKEKENGKIF